MKKMLTTLCVLILLASCAESECQTDENVLTKGQAGEPRTSEILLGEEIPNPYSCQAMINALEKMTPEERGGLTAAMLRPTHYHVRFNPRTEEEVNTLSSNPDFSIRNWPYNRKVLQDGDVYTPKGASGISPLYATVPAGIQIPEIPYEITDSIIFMEEPKNPSGPPSPNALTYSKWQNLENKSYQILGLTEEGAGAEGPSAKYEPTGRISVYDSVLGRNVGLEGIRVTSYRDLWFMTCNYAYTFSKPDGTFSMGRTYNYKVKFKFTFFNPNTKLEVRGPKNGFSYWLPGTKGKTCNFVVTDKKYAFAWRAGTALRTLPTNKYIPTSGHTLGYFVADIPVGDLSNFSDMKLLYACAESVVTTYGWNPVFTGIDPKIKASFLSAVAYEILYYHYNHIKVPFINSIPKVGDVYFTQPNEYNKQGWNKKTGDKQKTPLFIDMEDIANQQYSKYFMSAQELGPLAQYLPDDRISVFPMRVYIDWMQTIKTENDLRQCMINNRPPSLSISDIDFFLSQYR